MDSYAQHLRAFRFWNRLGIVTVMALLPVVVFGAFMAQRLSDFHALPYLLVAMWLVALGNALYRIRTFRCPRCEKTFSVHGWWMPNTRDRKCVHCALDLGARPDAMMAPSTEAGTMDTSEFEAKLKREGFLDTERKQGQPNFISKPHTHPYDVQALVLDGEITLEREGKAQTFRAGDCFEMAAGCLHTEHYGPAGYSFLVGRRHPPA